MKRKESKIKFVGLHGHTTIGSPGDAIGYPDEHMDFAWENGMDALATTDHGTMNALSYQVLHAKKMAEKGKEFKPIFGVEAYFINSVDNWKDLYEETKKNKTKIKKSDEKAELIENEEETKGRTKFNPLNERSHLVLLAQNEVGLKNLFQVVSKSYGDDNFYRYPRVDFDLLKEHNEGIIVSTACLGSYLMKPVWEAGEDFNDTIVFEQILSRAEEFKSIFGDRFFLELQWNAIKQQHVLNKYLVRASKELNTPLISTADSHYPRPDLWKDRILYKKLAWLSKGGGENSLPGTIEEVGYELYPKNGDQMWDSYKDYSKVFNIEYDDDLILESIERTHDIAFDMIGDFTPDTSIKLPSFVVPEGKTPDRALAEFCIEGLRTKGLHKNKEYIDRLKFELNVIGDRDFSKYFLTMKVLADKGAERGLSGPGRGSAAGALVAYVLGITQVDPIKWSLQFERFLRPSDDGYPDIDFDVSGPHDLKEHLANEWGKNAIVPISNFNTLKLRSLIKDISKFYEIPFKEVNDVTSVMVSEATPEAKRVHGITAGVYIPTFEETKEYSASLKQFLREYPEVEVHINNLHGQVRSLSRHAGGCVIAENLDQHMPLIKSGGVLQTPWTEGQNVRHLEPLGFIKFDILGLSTIEMIQDAIRQVLIRHFGNERPVFSDVKNFYDRFLHPDTINFDNQDIYEGIYHSDEKWFSIFQFTEPGVQSFCQRAKPRSLEDLAMITSVYRPGPLGMGVDKKILAVRSGEIEARPLHPLIEEETRNSSGFVVYQEQIATIAHKLGDNISLDDGNFIRKLLTKKGTGKEGLLEEYRERFLRGSIAKGIQEEDAVEIWKTLEAFSKYGFNKSHGLAYAMISYQCAWLAYYYPVEWLAAFLEKNSDDDEKKQVAISRVKAAGFKVSLPNIASSKETWTISEDGTELFLPLNSIKGFGDKAVREVLNSGPYNTIEDLIFNEEISYRIFNKRCLDVLARSHALDDLVDERFNSLKHFWKCIADDRPKTPKKLEENIEKYGDLPPFTNEENIENIVTLTGIYPIRRVLSDAVYEKLLSMQVRPLGMYDKEKPLCWFIIRDIEEKATRKGKKYLIIKTTDSTFKSTQIKCWGYNPNDCDIVSNKVYIGKVDHDEKWGYSINKLWKNVRCIS